MKFLLRFFLVVIFFAACTHLPDYRIYQISDVDSFVADTLKGSRNYRINKVELKIKGNIRGKAELKIENGNGRYKRVFLQGRVDTLYQSEWYEPRIIFHYTPLTPVTGDSLVIFYRFR